MGKHALLVFQQCDRVAQMVVVMTISPSSRHTFMKILMLIRGKSALDAVAKRGLIMCFHWVVDLDIKGFFDKLTTSYTQIPIKAC